MKHADHSSIAFAAESGGVLNYAAQFGESGGPSPTLPPGNLIWQLARYDDGRSDRPCSVGYANYRLWVSRTDQWSVAACQRHNIRRATAIRNCRREGNQRTLRKTIISADRGCASVILRPSIRRCPVISCVTCDVSETNSYWALASNPWAFISTVE
jgi:hypothetical protein